MLHRGGSSEKSGRNLKGRKNWEGPEQRTLGARAEDVSKDS